MHFVKQTFWILDGLVSALVSGHDGVFRGPLYLPLERVPEPVGMQELAIVGALDLEMKRYVGLFLAVGLDLLQEPGFVRKIFESKRSEPPLHFLNSISIYSLNKPTSKLVILNN